MKKEKFYPVHIKVPKFVHKLFIVKYGKEGTKTVTPNTIWFSALQFILSQEIEDYQYTEGEKAILTIMVNRKFHDRLNSMFADSYYQRLSVFFTSYFYDQLKSHVIAYKIFDSTISDTKAIKSFLSHYEITEDEYAFESAKKLITRYNNCEKLGIPID